MDVGSIVRIKQGCGAVSTWMWGKLGIYVKEVIRPHSIGLILIRVPVPDDGHCNQTVYLDDVDEV